MKDLIPHWLARPASVFSTLTALTGAGLLFWAAVTGAYWWAIWGVVCFVGAGLLWYLADYAGTAVPTEHPEPGGG